MDGLILIIYFGIFMIYFLLTKFSLHVLSTLMVYKFPCDGFMLIYGIVDFSLFSKTLDYVACFREFINISLATDRPGEMTFCMVN